MHAVRTRRQRYIEAIVDEHAGRRASHRLDTPPDEVEQLARREIAFPDLNQVDTGHGRGAHLVDELFFRFA